MYVNADSVYIEEITPSVAKKMIIEKHYTHAFSMCRYALGIYYVGEQDHKFYNEKEKKLISQKNVLSQEEFEKKLKNLRGDITNFQRDRNKKINEINKSRIRLKFLM